MALKVWFEDDIRNILSGVAQAGDLLPNSNTPEDLAYVRGFNAALNILYTSFGVGAAGAKTISAERTRLEAGKYLVEPSRK